MEGVLAKALLFCRLEMLPLHLQDCLVWVKAIQDVVVLPSQKIISKSLIYLLMFLRSWEGQLSMLYFLHPFLFSLILFLGDSTCAGSMSSPALSLSPKPCNYSEVTVPHPLPILPILLVQSL